MRLLPKLLNNMYFVFLAKAFDDVHDIWIHEKLKSDYLKNKKSFQSGIKNIFPC